MKYGALYVALPGGQTFEVELELPSVIVGRAGGSGIVLDDITVARRHARFTVESGHLTVEDLGSATGTFVGGYRIPVGQPSLVEVGQEVRLGDAVLRYAEPVLERGQASSAEAVAALALPVLHTEPTDTPEVPAIPDIRAVLEGPIEPVLPGGGATLTLRLINRAHVVDRLAVVISGLPSAWVEAPAAPAALLPGGEAELTFAVTVPRTAAARAGIYDVTATVTSHESGHEVLAHATLEVAPFESPTLSLLPLRSKRDFTVAVENAGNHAITFDLAAADAEEAFRFAFSPPTVTVAPGETARVPLRVRRPRRIYGPPTIAPFNVRAVQRGGGLKSETQGQLAVRPWLVPFPQPLLLSAMLVTAIVALIVFFFVPDGGGVSTANAEAPYEGVHMCDKGAKAVKELQSDQETAAEDDSGEPAPGQGQSLFPGSKSGAPFFAQNNPIWANDEYAKAQDPDFGPDWCGTTIEQCGCAMTSVTTVMAVLGVVTMPDGSELTPQAVNEWFNRNARKTARGWVSQGYIYGDVIWTAANQLSGEIAAQFPGSPTIRFVRTGTGSDAEIRAELAAGRPIVLEVPGHWISATGLEGDRIVINDPYYRDRKYLDTAYPGKVKSSVLFEKSSDLSAVVISVPKDVRVKVTDKEGRVVGTLNTGTADEAAKAAEHQIPGASYSTRSAWRDPTCVESPPGDDDGTNQIILPGNRDDYKIEVIETAGGANSSVAIHTYDKDGTPQIRTIDATGDGKVEANVAFDPATGGTVSDITGGTATGSTPAKTTPAPAEPEGTATPGASASPPPSGATTTPATPPAGEAPPTTNLTVPVEAGATVVPIASANGFTVGDIIRFAAGRPNEEDNRIIGFGSFILATPLRFAHGPGETITRVGVSAGGAKGEDGPAGAVIQPPKPPEAVNLACTSLYIPLPKAATLICSATIDGIFTNTRWSVNGKEEPSFAGRSVIIQRYTADTPVLVSFSACNVTACKATAATEAINFAANIPAGFGTASAAGTNTGPVTAAVTNAPPPPPPVPLAGVAIDCNVAYDHQAKPTPKAIIQCSASYAGAYTSIGWSAPEAVTRTPTGRTFAAEVLQGTPAPDDSGVATVTVTASFCNLAQCTSSPPKKVAINYSSILLTRNPTRDVPVGNTVTLFGLVTGPESPSGGSVQFYDNETLPIGEPAPIFEFPGIGFASVPGDTGLPPLDKPEPAGVTPVVHKLTAVYAGSNNMFGSTSEILDMSVVPAGLDICNSVDDNSNPLVDEACFIPGEEQLAHEPQVDLGSSTIITNVQLSSGAASLQVGPDTAYWDPLVGAGRSIIVTPGAQVTVSGQMYRDSSPISAITPRQVYVTIGQSTATGFEAPKPVCIASKVVDQYGQTAAVPQSITGTITAPTAPGIYYLRGVGAVAPNCGQGPQVPTDLNVGRIIVQARAEITTAVAPVQLTPLPACPPLVTGSCVHLGDSIRLSGAVTKLDNGTGKFKGTVEIREGNLLLAVAGVNADGTYAIFVPTSLLYRGPNDATSVGPHDLTARYVPELERRGSSPDIYYPPYLVPDASASAIESAALTINILQSRSVVTLTGPFVNSATCGGTPGTPLPNVEVGKPWTFCASVVDAVGPTGTDFGPFAGNLRLYAGGTLVGTLRLDTASGQTLTTAPGDRVVITLPALAAAHSVVARYEPLPNTAGSPSNYATADSPAITFVVTKNQPAVSLTRTGTGNVDAGRAVDISGTVTSTCTDANCGGLAGELRIFDGPTTGTPIATIASSAATCAAAADGPCYNATTGKYFATLTTGAAATLAAGDHGLVTRFVPTSGNYATADSAPLTFTVARNQPAVTLVRTGTGTVDAGQAVPLSGAVTVSCDTDCGGLAGELRIFDGPTTGTPILTIPSSAATCAVAADGPCYNAATGAYFATLTTGASATLGAGDHGLVTRFVPTSGNYNSADSSPVRFNILAIATTITVTAEKQGGGTPNIGDQVTLAATVTPSACDTTTCGPLTGRVDFFDGPAAGTAIGCAGAAGCTGTYDPATGAASITLTSGANLLAAAVTPPHKINAAYVPAGSSNFAGASTTTAADLVVNPSPTTTGLTLTTPVTIGQQVTLTADVTRLANFGNYTGVVNFCYVQGTPNPVCPGSPSLGWLGVGVVNGTTGQATLTLNTSVNTLPATGSPYSITAQYTGGGNYAGSASAAGALTVNAATPTVTITFSPSPVPHGRDVTVRATLTKGAFGDFAGTFDFCQGTAPACTTWTQPPQGGNPGDPSTGVAIQQQGGVQFAEAVFDTGDLSGTGAASFSATFTPTTPSNYAQASGTAAVNVAAAASTVGGPGAGGATDPPALSSATIAMGNSTTVTAVVRYVGRKNSGNFSGHVYFCRSTGDCTGPGAFGFLGEATAFNTSPTGGGAGVATITLPASVTAAAPATVALNVGTHSIIATYVPDGSAKYAGSTSRAATLTVTGANTTTALTANSPTVGSPVLLQATVASSTGNQGLYDGKVSFCTGTSTPCTSLSATYIGCAGNDAACTSSSGITPSYNPAFGAGTFALSITTPNATFPVGTAVSLTATYSGGGGYGGSSSTAPHPSTTVQKAATSVSVDTLTGVTVGANVTLAATVTSTIFCNTGLPLGGTVDFFADGSATVLASASVAANASCSGNTATSAGNSVSVTTSAAVLPAGGHKITARYNGNGTYATSTSATPGSDNLTVAKANTTVTNVTLSAASTCSGGAPSPLTTASSVYLSADISSGFADSVNGFQGTVQFRADSNTGTILGNATLATGETSGCTAAAASLAGFSAPGDHTIVAIYTPTSTNYNGAEASSASVHILATTATTLQVGAGASPTFGSSATTVLGSGETVTLRATVTPSGATGTVDFYDNTTKLGSGTFSAGAWTYNITPTSAGTFNQYNAVFVTNADYATSQSGTVSLTVIPAATTLTLSVPANGTLGSTFPVTASVNSGAFGTITGNVLVYDGSTSGTLLATCALPTGTAPPASPATCNASTTSLNAGAHTIVGVFDSSAANYADSATATATGGINIAGAATTVALSTPASVALGGSFAITATITTGSFGAIAGTVHIYEGTTSAGGTERATCAVSATVTNCTVATAPGNTVAMGVGSHTLVAKFVSSAANYANSGDSTTVSGSVTKADAPALTAPSLNPASIAAGAPGVSVQFSTGLSPAFTGANYNGTVTFTIKNAGGATVDTATATVTNSTGGTQSSTKTITLAAGTYTVTARYTGDSNYTDSASTAGTTLTVT